jgi:RNA-directed DNA polymerase
MLTLKEQFYKVVEFKNLYKANKSAKKGKRNKKEVVEFELNLNSNLISLKESIINKTYKIENYKIFKIYEPKERIIMSMSYKDRVLQHSLCDNVLTPFVEKLLIYDNCASRVGKGTLFGLNRIKFFIKDFYNKKGSEGYILKGDISKYFYSIDHDVLKSNLYKHIKDKDIKWLLDTIIDSTTSPGIPIGNMTSQLFAVFYLDKLDRLCKEKLKIKYYSRYMDDFVLIHENKDYLKYCLSEIKKLVENDLKLKLNPNKTQIFPLKNGVDYLGFHTYLTDNGKVIRKLRHSSHKRMKRKLKKFKERDVEYEKIKNSIFSWLGHVKHGNTYNLRKKILSNFCINKNLKY